MAHLKEGDFIHCNPLQFKQGQTKHINEIISLELPFVYHYVCHFEQNIFEGKKELYAYPEQVEELIIGHTILDLLPCHDANFTYELHKNEDATQNKYSLKLSATRTKINSLPKLQLAPSNLVEIMTNVLQAKGKWDGTGCFHRAALFHPKNHSMIIAEDIGRHNCVDRLKGHCIIKGLDISQYILFITARITSSLYYKIRRAGINNIVSRSAITSTAYLQAKQDNCTLAAFCRPEDNRVTIFTS